jgi:hypothetical protein
MYDLVSKKMLEILEREPGRADLRQGTPVEAFKKLMEEAKREIPAYIGDIWTYRIAIGVLGALTLTAAVGAILLKANVPEALVALGSTAVGALVGLFAPSPSGR